MGAAPVRRAMEVSTGPSALVCSWHTTGRRARDVTAPEGAALVRAFVDGALGVCQSNGPVSHSVVTESCEGR